MKIKDLQSGSNGNACLIMTPGTRILIDAGIPVTQLRAALKEAGCPAETLSAVLLTHEHRDHTAAAVSLMKKEKIPILATEGTFVGLTDLPAALRAGLNGALIRPGDTVRINDCQITAFALPHDSIDPVGYSIFDGEKRFTLATDLGGMTEEIYGFLQKSQGILLESNFDEDMLRLGPYPYPLKRRILGPLGHLSNLTAGQTAAKLLREDPDKLIIFGHMSETNNDPRLVLDAAFSELAAAGLDPLTLRLEMASRTEATGVFEL